MNKYSQLSEEIEKKFSSLKTKEEVTLALSTCTFLHKIPLPMCVVTLEQAEKDFRRERVLLNDVPFIPHKSDENRCHAFATSLKVLVQRLTSRCGSKKYLPPDTIAEMIMQRACRTSAGSDSFFMVQKLLCVEETFVAQKTFVHEPPIKIDVFISSTVNSEGTSMNVGGGDICARVEVFNCFSIYDVCLMDELTGNTAEDPPAWLDIESLVIDETNFNTREHRRKLQLVISCVSTGHVYRSTSDFESGSDKRLSGRISARLSGQLILRELSSWCNYMTRGFVISSASSVGSSTPSVSSGRLGMPPLSSKASNPKSFSLLKKQPASMPSISDSASSDSNDHKPLLQSKSNTLLSSFPIQINQYRKPKQPANNSSSYSMSASVGIGDESFYGSSAKSTKPFSLSTGKQSGFLEDDDAAAQPAEDGESPTASLSSFRSSGRLQQQRPIQEASFK